MLAVIVTIMTMTGRYICSVNSYCDNNGRSIHALFTFTVTTTGRSICSANSYCEHNGEVYMQCLHSLSQ